MIFQAAWNPVFRPERIICSAVTRKWGFKYQSTYWFLVSVLTEMNFGLNVSVTVYKWQNITLIIFFFRQITLNQKQLSRLGNQLFRYALLYGIAMMNNATPYLDEDYPLRKVFRWMASAFLNLHVCKGYMVSNTDWFQIKQRNWLCWAMLVEN